jgi:hypothetical protein
MINKKKDRKGGTFLHSGGGDSQAKFSGFFKELGQGIGLDGQRGLW